MRTQLLSHNKVAYQKVVKALETADRTCVVHPTGTGKSYLIAAVSESYKHVLILGPNDFVLNQVHDVLAWRKDGVGYMTYQMLNSMDEVPTGFDLICLDEFHRAGAPAWGVSVDDLLEQNPQAKVFGTTATPIRYLDNERDMSDEIFHRNVASHISIGEAWSRNILPIPTFVTGLFNFHKTIADAEERIRSSKKLTEDEKRRRIYKLSNARLEWENSMGMPKILQRHLDADIKRIIIFCSDIARLESMRETVIGWFRMGGFKVAGSCTVHIGQTDRQIREAMAEFESDEGEGVRLMFSVNMLNEGVHIPRVGAVLMLRTTASRIIYLQQMGRCLTAANTERPVILDMVDNITTTSAIHGLIDDFDGWQQLMKSELPDYEERRFNVVDYKQSLRDVLQKISPLELSFETWEEKLQQLMDFCEKHGRTPKRTDGDIFRKYMYLISNYRETEEMKFIIQKYARQIMWNDNNREFMEQELRDFIDTKHRGPSRWLVEDVRWYNMFKVIKKHEPEHPLVVEIERLEAERRAEERERYHQDCLEKTKAFLAEHGRLPKNTPLPDGSYEPANRSWVWLRKNYPDDPEVKAIKEQYGRTGGYKFIPVEQRIEMCEACCREKGRLPFPSYDDPIVVKSWHILRDKYADHPRVKYMKEHYPALPVNHKKMECGIKKVEDFFAKYGRLPYSRTNGKEEIQALNSMANIFEKYPDDPRVAALMAKRGRPVKLEKAIQKITDFEKEKGRLPIKNQESSEWASWRNLVDKHSDEPEVKALMEKYDDPDGCDWLATDEDRKAAKTEKRKEESAKYQQMKFETDLQNIRAFAQSKGRLPRNNSTTECEEKQIYYALRNLKDHYSDVAEVRELLESYPQISITLEKGIEHLLGWVEKKGCLPRDVKDMSKDDRWALSTWKALKKNYPDHPITKKLQALSPYGTDKAGRAIQMLVEFEAKWHRLPTSRSGGVDGETKVYEKLVYLKKEYADHPAVKAILDRYQDYDAREEIRRGVVARIDKWASAHGRLPEKNKNDKEELNLHNSFVRMKKKYPDMKEIKALQEKY